MKAHLVMVEDCRAVLSAGEGTWHGVMHREEAREHLLHRDLCGRGGGGLEIPRCNTKIGLAVSGRAS